MPQHQITVVDSTVVPRDGRNRSQDVPSGNVFEPRHAVRCVGELGFRCQAARDLGCLLDLDADVLAWTCLPQPLMRGTLRLVVDLTVTRASGTEFVVVPAGSEKFSVPDWAVDAAAERGAALRVVPAGDVAGDRLLNARELLRYAKWRVSLSQRIGLLAALDQEGSLTLIEGMSAVRGASDPMGVVAAFNAQRPPAARTGSTAMTIVNSPGATSSNSTST